MIDFIIGLTLVNAMPHFVLGVWKGRMLSGLGIGNRNNIGYAVLNFSLSVGLFLYQYGFAGLGEHLMYTGGLVTMVLYFILGQPFYKHFHEKYYGNQKETAEA